MKDFYQLSEDGEWQPWVVLHLGRGRGAKITRLWPGWFILDGGVADEPLGFRGGANGGTGWRRLRGHRAAKLLKLLVGVRKEPARTESVP
jgi:hypothetical protein